MSRLVDLSVFASNPTFTLDYMYMSHTVNHNHLIEYSVDGGAWTPLAAIASENAYNWTYRTLSVDLPSTADNVVLRIIGNGSGDWVRLDNIKVEGCLPEAAYATTDASGLYSFNALTGVLPNTTYQVRIDTTQIALAGLSLTLQDANGVTSNDPVADNIDSDAAMSGTDAVINPAPSPAIGENLGYDFGFGSATKDWGDLPDSFDTSTGNSGPNHTIDSTLYLGGCVDAEMNGQPDASAGIVNLNSGDDGNVGAPVTGTCTGNDDEDGVTLPASLVPNTQACVAVTAVNTGTAANLYGWVDFNGDGDFDGDANELLNSVDFTGGLAAINASGTANYCFDVPAGATFTNNETHMRFRLTRDTLGGATPWNGAAADGEVEDYYLSLTTEDWGDLPDTFDTLSSSSGPNHTIDNTLYLGDCVDAEMDGQPDAEAGMVTPNSGDDGNTGSLVTGACADSDDEDGVTLTTLLVANTQACVVVTAVNTGAAANLYGWVDFNGDSDFDGDANELLNTVDFTGGVAAISASGTGSYCFNVPVGATFTNNETHMRFRLTRDTLGGATPWNGTAADGEVEDYHADLVAKDWGDLPDTFDTLSGSNGPNHAIDNTLYLGDCVDAEINGQPDAEAGMVTPNSGDDGNTSIAPVMGTCTGNDDEDGVTLITPLVAGSQACVAVTAVNTDAAANLYGWVDFNGDGDFDGDANELLSTGDFSGGGGAAAITTSGSNSYCFDVPAGATFTGGETHMRFRLIRDTLGGVTPWNGEAANGEVEDYYQQLACVGNYVWSDTDGDGVQDGAESGLNGVTVSLVWYGMDSVSGGGDDVTYTVVTAQESGVDGKYSFCGLLPNNSSNNGGSYRTEISTLPTGMDITTPNGGGSDFDDNDGSQPGGPGTTAVGPDFTITVVNSMATGENSVGDSTHLYGTPNNQDDLSFDFGFADYDYGDLPDSNGAGAYPTTNTDGGEGAAARHMLDNTNYLGACVDAETDGQQNATANGDNGNTAGASPRVDGAACSDDEDGVASPVGLGDGTWGEGTGDLNVTGLVGSGCLVAWVDWNSDGDFDDAPNGVSELIYVDSLASGAHALTFSTQLDSVYSYPGVLNVRFRLFTAAQLSAWGVACDSAGVSSRYTGSAIGGEVEDYQWSFNSPTAVSLSSTNAATASGSLILISILVLGILLMATITAVYSRRRHQIH